MRCDNLGLRVQISLTGKRLTIEVKNDLSCYGKPIISTTKLAANKQEMLYQMAEAIGPVEIWMVICGEITFGSIPGAREDAKSGYTLEIEEIPFYHCYAK